MQKDKWSCFFFVCPLRHFSVFTTQKSNNKLFKGDVVFSFLSCSNLCFAIQVFFKRVKQGGCFHSLIVLPKQLGFTRRECRHFHSSY